ncbi:MAG: hypothetical protein LQ351_007595 [Letrouitia transgressa]|nr:MAG: hypothetical protein LQ351_007595 [Letrouitia transgressa]
MPLRHKLATQREHAKAAANSSSSEASQTLSDPRRKAQKRKHAAEDEHSQKRLRKDPPSALVPAAASQDLVGVWQARGKKRPYDSSYKHLDRRRRGSVPEFQLSEENLKKLERETPMMDPIFIAPDRVRKRAPSRQASFSDLNQDTASLPSQKSSGSNNIQDQMDIIFKHEIPKERRRETSGIAKMVSQSFIKNLRGAHREDDLVELIYEALRMMHKDETIAFPRKADWEPSLKPDVQQEFFNWDALGQSNNAVNDVAERPSKRQPGEQQPGEQQPGEQQQGEQQQGERSFPSPDTSRSTIPPLVALS